MTLLSTKRERMSGSRAREQRESSSGVYCVAMAFCSHCGQAAAEGVRFCAGCGAPLAKDAAEGLTAELRRQGRQMQVLVGAAVLVLAMVVGIVVFVATSRKPMAVGAPVAGSTAAPATQAQSGPTSATQSPSDQAAAPASGAPQPAAAGGPSASPAAGSTTPKGGIDLGAVQQALGQMEKRGASGSASAPAAAPSGSDRYPGSQPVNVDDANLPDIGIPVARQVYSTTDSVATVIRYYQQRYPDAQLMEINGQQVLAVDRPGAPKVIAIGTNGQETRIAIVQPGS